MSDKRQWHLRISDDTVFGPVVTRNLVLWAEQGRVLPGQTVSEDQEVWIPAENVPELEMEWYIEDSQGHLRGPLNKKAATKNLPKGAKLVHRADADLSRVYDAPIEHTPVEEPALIVVEPEPKLEPKQTAVQELKLHLEDEPIAGDETRLLKEQLETLRRQADETDLLRRELKLRSDELAALRSELDTARTAQSDTEEIDRARQIDELRAENDRLRRKRREQEISADDALRQRLAQIETENQRLEAELEKARGAEEPQAKSEDSQTKFKDLIHNLENEFAELLAASNERDLSYQARISELESRPQTNGIEDAYGLLAEELATLKNALEEERSVAQRRKEATIQRQDKLQTRIQGLGRILGDSADQFHRSAIRESSAAVTTRLQAEVGTLKANMAQELRAAAEKCAELERQVVQYKAEENRFKTQVSEAEKSTAKFAMLEDDFKYTEQLLEQERKIRTSDQEQFNSIQESLLRRIEELERTNPFIATEQKMEDSRHSAFRPTPWLRFKK